MRQFISKNNFIVSICVVILILVFSCFTFIGCNNYQNREKYPLTENDLKFLNESKKSNENQNYEDNKLYIAFRELFSGNIGLSYFNKIPNAEVVQIENMSDGSIIKKGDNGIITIPKENKPLLRITFSTHNKNILLSSKKEIESYAEILFVELEYISDVQPISK